MQKCTHAKTDNKGYTNCTKGNSHIGLCKKPCPYGRKLHLQHLAQCTYISREAHFEAETLKEARGKLRLAAFECTYILTVADGVDV